MQYADRFKFIDLCNGSRFWRSCLPDTRLIKRGGISHFVVGSHAMRDRPHVESCCFKG